MLHLTELLTAGTPTGTATLTLDERRRSRLRLTLDDGREAALLLPRGSALREGDLLRADEGDVIVLKHAGPVGAPGMPEWGALPIPKKLLKRGVKDMLRISDARMSGTAYGTVVLHVAPEARAGGPLAVVQDGDWIVLDCDAGRLHLDISEEELAARLAVWSTTRKDDPADASGYRHLYVQHVLQADQGCDFDFLVGCRGADVPRHSH